MSVGSYNIDVTHSELIVTDDDVTRIEFWFKYCELVDIVDSVVGNSNIFGYGMIYEFNHIVNNRFFYV